MRAETVADHSIALRPEGLLKGLDGLTSFDQPVEDRLPCVGGCDRVQQAQSLLLVIGMPAGQSLPINLADPGLSSAYMIRR